jgi:RNA polymerase sigma-70 factor (ECF subfamily)
MTELVGGAGFAEECLAHAGPILAYLQAAVGRGGEAEDLAQDVFAQALGHRREFAGGDLRAWLYRLARNRLAMHFRRRRVERSGMETMRISRAGPEPGTAGAPAALLRQERHRALLAEVELLPELDREAVRLRFSEGFDNAWIAGELGVTAGHLGVILHRALLKLRAGMERRGWSWQ